jgi:hypothetical protein
VFVRYKKNTTKQFRIYILDLDYVIYSSVMTFDELEKDNTINLRFRGIRNILPDYKLKSRPKNKVPELEEQKIILKPPRQFKNNYINLSEPAPVALDYSLKSPYTRPIISVEVPKKSVT